MEGKVGNSQLTTALEGKRMTYGQGNPFERYDGSVDVALTFGQNKDPMAREKDIDLQGS
jgi:hypothetical protein